MAHATIEGGGSEAVPVIDEAAARLAKRRLAWRRSGRAALLLFCSGTLLFIAAVFAAVLLPARFNSPTPWTLASGLSTLLVGAGVVRSIETLWRRVGTQEPLDWQLAAVALVSLLTGGCFTLFGFVATMFSLGGGRGRQLRARGKVLLPPVGAGADWDHLELRSNATQELREKLAAQWRENGKTEHASVAAFARLSLNLIALGAPPELLNASNRDSLDEIRHAELCFSFARALDGKRESPGPFPQAQSAGSLSRIRAVALAQLAVSSLIDGALHEGLSARVIAKLARRAEDPGLRQMLHELAADEGRHAAHGWDVVEWCLAEGGAKVAHALLGALRAVPKETDYSLAPEARDGWWERLGIAGEALEAEEHAKARADLILRVQRMTATRLAAPAA